MNRTEAILKFKYEQGLVPVASRSGFSNSGILHNRSIGIIGGKKSTRLASIQKQGRVLSAMVVRPVRSSFTMTQACRRSTLRRTNPAGFITSGEQSVLSSSMFTGPNAHESLVNL